MDSLTLFGLVIIGLVIGGSQVIEGSDVSLLFNGPALLIVLGGTLAAVFIQSSLKQFMHALRLLLWLFKPPKIRLDLGIKKIFHWSITARREGLIALQNAADESHDLVVKNALLLLADGRDSILLRQALELEIDALEQRDIEAANIFESMAGYCPTIGILGAVLGLMQVLNNLSDIETLGPGIAVAFVATVYGVGFANLLFLPIARKLKALVLARSRYYETMLEGFLAIADGENPRLIEYKLQGALK